MEINPNLSWKEKPTMRVMMRNYKERYERIGRGLRNTFLKKIEFGETVATERFRCIQ